MRIVDVCCRRQHEEIFLYGEMMTWQLTIEESISILNFFFPPNRGVDFYFEFLRAKSRGRFYFEFLPAKIHREEAPADDR